MKKIVERVQMFGFLAIMCCLVIALASAGNAWGQSASVKAQWDSNTEPDLAGYKLYWSQTSGTYSNSFVIPLSSFVEKPDWNEIPTGWLQPGTWYFAATAFDTTGNESGYSDEVYIDVPDLPPGSPKTITFKLVLPDGTEMTMTVVAP